MSLWDHPVIAHQRGRLFALLKDLSFQERDVILSSGARSRFYVDGKQTSLNAEGLFLIGQLFRAVIEEVAPEAQAVGGLTLGADPLVCATSLTSFLAGRPLHAFIARKEPKGHGTGAWIEGHGNLEPGMPVVILEDVITTGASALCAIERARGAGLRVLHVLALVDRQEGGREAIEAEAPVTALFSRQDFLP